MKNQPALTVSIHLRQSHSVSLDFVKLFSSIDFFSLFSAIEKKNENQGTMTLSKQMLAHNIEIKTQRLQFFFSPSTIYYEMNRAQVVYVYRMP